MKKRVAVWLEQNPGMEFFRLDDALQHACGFMPTPKNSERKSALRDTLAKLGWKRRGTANTKLPQVWERA